MAKLVVVALVSIVDEALRLLKLAVVALTVVPESRLRPKTLEFKLTVLVPLMLMLVPPKTEVKKLVLVATTMPLLSRARTLPAVKPERKVWPVVVELVKMLEEAFKLLAVRVEMFEVEALMLPLMASRLEALIQAKLLEPDKTLVALR